MAEKLAEGREGDYPRLLSSHLSGAEVIETAPCGDEVGPSASLANSEEGHSHEELFNVGPSARRADADVLAGGLCTVAPEDPR